MKKAYIITGYGASPSDHWFNSVKQTLEEEGIQTTISQMPDPDRPNITTWLNYMDTLLAEADEDTVIIAHSLGCITLVRHLLAKQPLPHVKGLVFVSPFAAPLPTLPMLDTFIDTAVDISRLKTIAPFRDVIISTNDTIVPPRLSREFAAAIGATIHSVENGGHFLAEDTYTTFSDVATIVTEDFRQSSNLHLGSKK